MLQHTSAAYWVVLGLLLAVKSQIVEVVSQDEHNLIYQVLVPSKEYRVDERV